MTKPSGRAVLDAVEDEAVLESDAGCSTRL
jgi:hypothetical protein